MSSTIRRRWKRADNLNQNTRTNYVCKKSSKKRTKSQFLFMSKRQKLNTLYVTSFANADAAAAVIISLKSLIREIWSIGLPGHS